MAQVCAIDTRAEEDQSARVVLDEPHARVNLGREEEETEELWYLDTGASNQMTRNREAFSELDTGVVGTVKFGDNSGVDIRCCGTVVFQCKAGEHKALMDVYYIPKLRSNILNIGQLDERDCQVLIDGGVLRIRDRERKLLAKVERGRNRLYTLELRIARPVCLAARCDDAALRWHARFGHLSFDALARMAQQGMVRGLPLISMPASCATAALPGSRGGRRSPRRRATALATSSSSSMATSSSSSMATSAGQSRRQRTAYGAISCSWWTTAAATCGCTCCRARTRRQR